MKIFSNISPGRFAVSNLKLLIPFLLLVGMKPSTNEGNEYSIKAMFIYNFTRHIEWPPSANAGTFRIGVFGKSEIVEALDAISMQKKVDNRPIEIRIVEPDDNSFYQIIFVSRSQSDKIQGLVKKYTGKGVLIVSEECKLSEHGATINLITFENKVRFELNLPSARSAGLKISAALTKLAIVVNP